MRIFLIIMDGEDSLVNRAATREVSSPAKAQSGSGNSLSECYSSLPPLTSGQEGNNLSGQTGFGRARLQSFVEWDDPAIVLGTDDSTLRRTDSLLPEIDRQAEDSKDQHAASNLQVNGGDQVSELWGEPFTLDEATTEQLEALCLAAGDKNWKDRLHKMNAEVFDILSGIAKSLSQADN